jgi:2,5-diamino-6-(ribosylamino)-4(3H)-pyrimidinone 5'-phosphate reductase
MASRNKKRAEHPRIICHMAPSVDGRIVTTNWDVKRSITEEYERTAKTFDADAWIIGRVSMEPYAGKARVPRSSLRIPRNDFIARSDAKSYAIAIDPSGKLTWRSGSIDDEHVITILTERVSNAYLAFLQSKGVSYLFGGKVRVDLRKIVAKLAVEFGIRTLLLEGGGKINGSFLAADLIDELSLLIAPIADGSTGTPSLFDAEKGAARRFELISVQKLKDDIVWLRYKVRR